MAILGFKKRFVDPIRKRTKIQTIRGFRKYPIVEGEHLYLYTGLRTKHSEKIGEAQCMNTNVVRLSESSVTLQFAGYDHHFSDTRRLNRFAVKDGFKNWDALVTFWKDEHGPNCFPFTGTIIYFKLLPKSYWATKVS